MLDLLDLDLLDDVDALRFALPFAFSFFELFASCCAWLLSRGTDTASSFASSLGEEGCVLSASSFSAGDVGVGAEAVAAGAVGDAVISTSTGGCAEPLASHDPVLHEQALELELELQQEHVLEILLKLHHP